VRRGAPFGLRGSRFARVLDRDPRRRFGVAARELLVVRLKLLLEARSGTQRPQGKAGKALLLR